MPMALLMLSGNRALSLLVLASGAGRGPTLPWRTDGGGLPASMAAQSQRPPPSSFRGTYLNQFIMVQPELSWS